MRALTPRTSSEGGSVAFSLKATRNWRRIHLPLPRPIDALWAAMGVENRVARARKQPGGSRPGYRLTHDSRASEVQEWNKVDELEAIPGARILRGSGTPAVDLIHHAQACPAFRLAATAATGAGFPIAVGEAACEHLEIASAAWSPLANLQNSRLPPGYCSG